MKIPARLKKIALKTFDWFIDICFYLCLLVVAYIVLQVFVVTSFSIPTNSMVPTLQPGDRILVDKCSGGARLFNVFASLRGEEVSIHRMPGWRSFRRNDVLVFNFPYPEGRWDSISFDVMKYYVKRCVALPGDTLEIRNGYLHIRGLGQPVGYLDGQRQVAALPDSVPPGGVVMDAFPGDKRVGWTIRRFGPLPVPRKGQCVQLDSLSCALYRSLVRWEQRRPLRWHDGHAWLGDSVVSTYRFCEDYYFMAGDNALNSQDSRYWGLLPEPYIVGRVWRVWLSRDPFTGDVRRERLLKKVE